MGTATSLTAVVNRFQQLPLITLLCNAIFLLPLALTELTTFAEPIEDCALEGLFPSRSRGCRFQRGRQTRLGGNHFGIGFDFAGQRQWNLSTGYEHCFALAHERYRCL